MRARRTSIPTVARPWACEPKANAAPVQNRARRGYAKKSASASGGNLQLRADMQGDLGGVEKNEMADFVVGDAPKLGPRAERAD